MLRVPKSSLTSAFASVSLRIIRSNMRMMSWFAFCDKQRLIISFEVKTSCPSWRRRSSKACSFNGLLVNSNIWLMVIPSFSLDSEALRLVMELAF